MITGVHALIYSKEAEKVRAIFRDVLKLPNVDVGQGWLIFAMPPAEAAVHPTEAEGYHELYLMCDDVHKTLDELKSNGVNACRPVTDAGWGLVTSLHLPGGDEIGLYQPKHPLPPKHRTTKAS